MKLFKNDPRLICFDCRNKLVNCKNDTLIVTCHENKCDICGKIKSVFNISDDRNIKILYKIIISVKDFEKIIKSEVSPHYSLDFQKFKKTNRGLFVSNVFRLLYYNQFNDFTKKGIIRLATYEEWKYYTTLIKLEKL